MIVFLAQQWCSFSGFKQDDEEFKLIISAGDNSFAVQANSRHTTSRGALTMVLSREREFH